MGEDPSRLQCSSHVQQVTAPPSGATRRGRRDRKGAQKDGEIRAAGNPQHFRKMVDRSATLARQSTRFRGSVEARKAKGVAVVVLPSELVPRGGTALVLSAHGAHADPRP